MTWPRDDRTCPGGISFQACVVSVKSTMGNSSQPYRTIVSPNGEKLAETSRSGIGGACSRRQAVAQILHPGAGPDRPGAADKSRGTRTISGPFPDALAGLASGLSGRRLRLRRTRLVRAKSPRMRRSDAVVERFGRALGLVPSVLRVTVSAPHPCSGAVTRFRGEWGTIRQAEGRKERQGKEKDSGASVRIRPTTFAFGGRHSIQLSYGWRTAHVMLYAISSGVKSQERQHGARLRSLVGTKRPTLWSRPTGLSGRQTFRALRRGGPPLRDRRRASGRPGRFARLSPRDPGGSRCCPRGQTDPTAPAKSVGHSIRNGSRPMSQAA